MSGVERPGSWLEVGTYLRLLVADTQLKLEQDEHSGDLLQDLLVRLEDLTGVRGPEPMFPLIPDAVERLAELRS